MHKEKDAMKDHQAKRPKFSYHEPKADYFDSLPVQVATRIQQSKQRSIRLRMAVAASLLLLVMLAGGYYWQQTPASNGRILADADLDQLIEQNYLIFSPGEIEHFAATQSDWGKEASDPVLETLSNELEISDIILD
ncbi:MAG: hypothetical protein RIS47_1856 [Bacteroidota bacterium]|jgi:hypothetical protein